LLFPVLYISYLKVKKIIRISKTKVNCAELFLPSVFFSHLLVFLEFHPFSAKVRFLWILTINTYNCELNLILPKIVQAQYAKIWALDLSDAYYIHGCEGCRVTCDPANNLDLDETSDVPGCLVVCYTCIDNDWYSHLWRYLGNPANGGQNEQALIRRRAYCAASDQNLNFLSYSIWESAESTFLFR